MRVVSQNGNVDLPYEQIDVCHATENVVALHNEKQYVLGSYSSQEKAYKAMKMLRETYLLKAEVHSDYNHHHYKVALNKVFQFPQDNEIEV